MEEVSVFIRDAREDDLPRLAEIETVCFTHPWTEGAFRWSTEEGKRLLTACAGDTVLGYVALWPILDEGEIANVAVAPEARRKHVGDALLTAAEALARELGLVRLQLEARAGNAPALALYKKHGFAVVGQRKDYYETPREDAVLMTLELN